MRLEKVGLVEIQMMRSQGKLTWLEAAFDDAVEPRAAYQHENQHLVQHISMGCAHPLIPVTSLFEHTLLPLLAFPVDYPADDLAWLWMLHSSPCVVAVVVALESIEVRVESQNLADLHWLVSE